MPKRPQGSSTEELAIQQTIGARIKEARERVGVGQREAARKLGYSQTWLQAIEHGRNGISAADVVRLARLLSYPPAFFLEPDFDQPRPPSNRYEWERLYPDSPDLAKLHAQMDDTFKRSPQWRSQRRLFSIDPSTPGSNL